MDLASTKDKFAEIFVVGDENAPLTYSSSQDLLITRLGHGFTDSQDIVTSAAQVLDNRHTRGLVYNKSHSGWRLGKNVERQDVLISQHLGRIGQGCADVFRLQAWIFMEDIAFWNALGQHAHDQFYRNARSTDDRLANHDLGVN